MRDDLTIIYYSANRIGEDFADAVRMCLVRTAGMPIPSLISVTHKPIEFGENIVVDFPICIWSIYKQVLIGAEAADTEFVACAEDDTLYPPHHFEYRPSANAFAYTEDRWWLELYGKDWRYRTRRRVVMSTCIAPRQLLIETLRARFEKYPKPFPNKKDYVGWGEPGRVEHWLGLPEVQMELYKNEIPVISVNHKLSIGNIKRASDTDETAETLPYWGSAEDLAIKLCL